MNAYLVPLVEALIVGEPRNKLRKRIIGRYRQIRESRRDAHRLQWIYNLVTMLRQEGAPKDPHMAIQYLSSLRAAIDMTPFEWQLLLGIRWIRRTAQEPVNEGGRGPPNPGDLGSMDQGTSGRDDMHKDERAPAPS